MIFSAQPTKFEFVINLKTVQRRAGKVGWPVFGLPPLKKCRRRDRAHLVSPNGPQPPAFPDVNADPDYALGAMADVGGLSQCRRCPAFSHTVPGTSSMNVSSVLTSCGWAAEPMADQTNQTKKAAKRLRHIS